MIIYPKTSEMLEGLDNLKDEVLRNQGLEIQYFSKNEEEIVDFEMTKAVEEAIVKFPNLQEITVHPPLYNYEIELQLIKDKEIFLNQIKNIVKLSKKHNIKINIIEHTRLVFAQMKRTIIPVLKEAIDLMKDSNTKVLFENLYMVEERKNCSVIELCHYLNNEHIKVCIDMCHLYCQSHIYKENIESFLEKYLNKEKCKEQVYQIHFSYTANNDGYIDRATHGIMHPNKENLFYDADLLCKYGMKDCNWVIEVSEKDYSLRKDEKNEFKMLLEYSNIKN